MFCLDYAISFVAHYALASRCGDDTASNPLFTFTSGAVAGRIAAIVLYPFAIVRMTTVPAGTSHFAMSTVPFMSVYLGFYFTPPPHERRDKPLSAKVR